MQSGTGGESSIDAAFLEGQESVQEEGWM